MTTEPAHLEPMICNKGGNYNEKRVHCNKQWPLLAATRESPHVANKTQHYQHSNYKGPRRREKKGYEKIFEEIIAIFLFLQTLNIRFMWGLMQSLGN